MWQGTIALRKERTQDQAAKALVKGRQVCIWWLGSRLHSFNWQLCSYLKQELPRGQPDVQRREWGRHHLSSVQKAWSCCHITQWLPIPMFSNVWPWFKFGLTIQVPVASLPTSQIESLTRIFYFSSSTPSSCRIIQKFLAYEKLWAAAINYVFKNKVTETKISTMVSMNTSKF